MKRLLTSLALMSCLTVGTATSAHAAIFVDQAPDTTTQFAKTPLSDFGAARQPQQGDVFSLSQGVEKINAVWYGGYISDDFFLARPPLTTDDFTVDFFAVTGGVAATSSSASFSGVDLEVTRIDTGISLPPDPTDPNELKFELYRYQAVLDFAAIGAVLLPLNDYLFSVAANSTGTADTNWYWLSSPDGSNVSKARGGPPGNANAWTTPGLNLAYTLSAPTPPTVSIFLAGLVFLGWVHRIHRKSA